MSWARRTAFDIVAHAAWMFAAWAMARIALWMYMLREIAYPDDLLKVATDVEIHSLRFRWGWDLVLFVLFAAVVAVVQKVRGRNVFTSTAIATLIATALSLAMAMYPALTLSGRLGTPVSGVNGALKESIAFAIVVTLALVSMAVLLARARREVPGAGSGGHGTWN